jgi:hypothetical protein
MFVDPFVLLTVSIKMCLWLAWESHLLAPGLLFGNTSNYKFGEFSNLIVKGNV